MDTLYLIMPAYNEEANIAQVIEDWYPVVEKTGSAGRMVIVDDGSRDSTYALAKEAALTRPQLIPLTKRNGGHGAAVLYGYDYALEQNADYIFQTDSDGQTNPEEFWAFWKQRDQYDMVIGKRCHDKDAKGSDPSLFRRIRAGCQYPLPSYELADTAPGDRPGAEGF